MTACLYATLGFRTYHGLYLPQRSGRQGQRQNWAISMWACEHDHPSSVMAPACLYAPWRPRRSIGMQRLRASRGELADGRCNKCATVPFGTATICRRADAALRRETGGTRTDARRGSPSSAPWLQRARSSFAPCARRAQPPSVRWLSRAPSLLPAWDPAWGKPCDAGNCGREGRAACQLDLQQHFWD